MKKLLLISIGFFSLTVAHAQTNVSGGIYTNTTWTLANSPYIVVDTVVVFPGVKLTIQPGVIVKVADNIRIEIRQSSLIAVGTSSDSITFTSNNISPTAGIWDALFFNGGNLTSKFKYCNFLYANNAIHGDQATYDTLIIKNSNFKDNISGINGGTTGNWTIVPFIDSCSFINNTNYGMYGFLGGIINHCTFSNNQTGFQVEAYSLVVNCLFNSNQKGLELVSGANKIDNCILNSNQYGLSDNFGNNVIKNCVADSNSTTGITLLNEDSLVNCEMKFNNIGLHSLSGFLNFITKNDIESNITGIKLEASTDSIYCNKICNNTSYDLYYNVNFGSNIYMPSNYWCTPDAASTSAVIYDGYDNINKGLVYFMPIDTEQCYLLTGINNPKPSNNNSFKIYPNPFSTQTTFSTAEQLTNATLTLGNCFGQTVALIKNINGRTVLLNRANLASGLYFVRLTEDNKIIATIKLIIVD